MRKYYIGVGILGFVIFLVLLASFSIIGSPFTQRKMKLDEQRLSNFSSIHYAIDSYYSTHNRLPTDINGIDTSYTKPDITDPETNEEYEYRVTGIYTYKLCATFSTDTQVNKPETRRSTILYTESYNQEDTSHRKGFDCIDYQVSSYYHNRPTPYIYQSPTPYAMPTPIGNLLKNNGFEEWDSGIPIAWIFEAGTALNQDRNSYNGYYALTFPANVSTQRVSSDQINFDSVPSTLTLSYIYRTSTDCSNCSFVGLRFTDGITGTPLASGAVGCGTYDPKIKGWVRYIERPTNGYSSNIYSCQPPKNAATVSVLLGVNGLQSSSVSFDEIKLYKGLSLSPTPTPSLIPTVYGRYLTPFPAGRNY